MIAEHEGDTRSRWLLSRVDRDCLDTIDELVRSITERLAIATADAVIVRVLSDDGSSLTPVAAHHPEAEVSAAMASVMGETQPAASGLWRPVVEERRPHRWHTPPGSVPPEASERQADFLRRLPVRAVLGVPLVSRDRVLGGLSLVRFGVDRPFTDEDEALAVACAARLAGALDFRAGVVALGE